MPTTQSVEEQQNEGKPLALAERSPLVLATPLSQAPQLSPTIVLTTSLKGRPVSPPERWQEGIEASVPRREVIGL